MTLDALTNLSDISNFLSGSQAILFTVLSDKDERYKQVEVLLRRFNYAHLSRSDKGVLIKFLIKISGYSRQQITRMIKRYLELGFLQRHQKTTNGFERHYTDTDARLLAHLDKLHDTPNGLRVKKLCERAYHKFGDKDFERLSNISVSHIYNLRQSKCYKNIRTTFTKTKSTHGSQIGTRKKPEPNGVPGYIRIDTVHQGDMDGVKGVYHINAVDEETQFEIVVSVERISEAYLIPALEFIIDAYPFKILNFHSDNGAEYINQTVAKLLNKLKIEMTKSRPRTSNDNALAEGKNAAVVRKTFGYAHIPQHFAKKINEFNAKALNPYINFHRPCLFPTIFVNEKGKQKKKYLYEDMMTPFEKFKSLDNAASYLKEGVTMKQLDDIAYEMTDNQAADLLQQERRSLFKHIHDNSTKTA